MVRIPRVLLSFLHQATSRTPLLSQIFIYLQLKNFLAQTAMTTSWILEFSAASLGEALVSRQDVSTMAPAGGIADVSEPRSSRQDTAIALVFLFGGLGFVLVSLRVYIRVKLKQFGAGKYDYIDVWCLRFDSR